MIPVMRPRVAAVKDVVPYLQEMERSGSFSNFGPLSRGLEARLAEALQVAASNVVVCSSATMGIAGSVAVAPRQNWLVPAWTFPATAESVLLAGHDLEFRDIDKATCVIDPLPHDDPTAYGLVPVVPFGQDFDFSPWSEWPVCVIDAAASLGNFPNLSQMPKDWAVVFSLHATKVLGAGEGGVAVFGSREGASRFRAWCNFGFSGSRESKFAGANAKMSEMGAAYALAALDNWEVERREWWEARLLISETNVTPAETLFSPHPEDISPYWIVGFDSEAAKCLAESAFEAAGIETRSWWPSPLPSMPAFAEAGALGSYPVADWYARTTLGLPCFRGISRMETQRIQYTLSQL